MNKNDTEHHTIPKWQLYTITGLFSLGIISWVIIGTGILDNPVDTPKNGDSGLSIGHGITIKLEPELKNRIAINDCEFAYIKFRITSVYCNLKNIGGSKYAPVNEYDLIYEVFDKNNVSLLNLNFPSKTLYGDDAIRQDFILKKDTKKIFIYVN